jgi:hypothetical protein
MALAERCGLADLARQHVSVGGPCGVNADPEVPCITLQSRAGN